MPGSPALAAALHLAGRGREVTVVERAATPGGRAGRLDVGGFRMDTGPTVLTMPDLVADTLAAVGEELPSRLDLVRLEPAYRALFADGSELDVHTDADAMASAVAAFAGPAEADGYRRLRAWLTELYRCEFGQFIAANFDSPFALATPSLARLAALGAFRRLEPAIGRFIHDERLRRVFSFQSLYAGESPQHALAVYAVIAYMDTVAGVYFPRGGMRALPDALAGAAESAGVQFRYGAAVTALDRSGSRIRAVHTGTGLRIPCDAVVLATELTTAYELLGRAPRRPLPLRPAPSAVVLHAGAGRRWPDAAHHTIVFGDAWQQTFREIITDGQLMSDPSLLVTRPTATDPALAPEGSDLVYILAPAPNLARGQIDWAGTASGYADQLAAIVGQPGAARPGRADHCAAGGDSGRLGAPGPGRRHAVLVRAFVPAEWPVPAGQPAARHGQRRSGGLRHRTRGRGADRADIWPARRRPGYRPGAPPGPAARPCGGRS